MALSTINIDPGGFEALNDAPGGVNADEASSLQIAYAFFDEYGPFDSVQELEPNTENFGRNVRVTGPKGTFRIEASMVYDGENNVIDNELEIFKESKQMSKSKSLIQTRLAEASGRVQNWRSATQVVQESQSKVLQEKKQDLKDEPLEKSFIQYIKQGNTFSPAGRVTLHDKLANCPYEIQLTMSGPVFERVKPTMDEVLVFENSPMNGVVKEIDRFWSRKEAYDRLGLMHNRGILMYGPPGTGKSICLQQVVEMMADRGDVVFFVKSPEAIIEGMKAFRQIEPTRKVVVSFEEADEMCRYNERAMLRLMDGDAKINGVLFLATTNYIEKLPERMLRPGRFDKKIYIGMPKYEHRLKYLSHKLKDMEQPQQIAELAKQSDGMGFGHLRELIASVYAIGDPLDEVLRRLKSNPHIGEGDPQAIFAPEKDSGMKTVCCGPSPSIY
jgi:ATP-dependent 26S proteasome regulatory subunit